MTKAARQRLILKLLRIHGPMRREELWRAVRASGHNVHDRTLRRDETELECDGMVSFYVSAGVNEAYDAKDKGCQT